MIGVVGHGHGLLESLRFVVNAAGSNGVDMAPILLVLGMHLGVAVYLTGAGNQHAGAFGLGQSKAVVDTQRSHLQGLNGDFQVVNGARRRSKVEDVVQLSLDVNELADIVVVELKTVESRQMLDVAQITGDKVVHPKDMVPLGDETVAEVRSQEACGPGD